MGDISIDIFLDTLKSLITSSNPDEKHLLQSVAKDIEYLRKFLKITEKKRYEHPQVMDTVMRIRDVTSKTQNIVELYVAFKAKHSLLEHHVHLSLDLDSLKKEIKTLIANAEHILDENMYDINGVAGKKLKSGYSSSSRSRHKFEVRGEKVVVGFEDEVRTLMEKLGGSGDGELEIFLIIGAGGCGKTTLAKEVYDNPLTLQRFEIRAWVNISQDYNKTMKRDILISILESAFTRDHEDYMKLSEDHLGEMVYKCLRGKKYLIVMDDIWNLEAWNDIRRSFPEGYNGSKVLLTSRLPVEPVGVRCVRHYLNVLSTRSSWELLQKQVFNEENCPLELVDIGTQIAEKCKGLPLAIVAIAGILKEQDKTIHMWEEVAIHLSAIIATNQEGTMEILELSYNHLPLHLKACFLYIGAKPKYKEISVRELIWLWIAEGFVQQNEGGKRLEDIAEDYLTNLIERNLIMVARKGSLGTIKAYSIHGLLQELCLKKAKEEMFFAQIYENESSSPFANRRLFIDAQFFNKFFSSPCAQNLCSFLCFSLPNDEAIAAKENFLISIEKLIFLRVLHFISGTIVDIRKGDLVHLRYLAISLPREQNHLAPKLFCCLLNLEILNLKATWDNILLPHDIFKMVKLRHLYTRRGTFTYHHVSNIEGEGNMLDSLQTLQRMGICEHCLRFLKRTPNLIKLGLSGHLCGEPNGALMLPDLEFLEGLKMLSLSGRELRAGVASAWLKLPSTLTKLTLEKTHLEWKKLSEFLQTLPSLETLKLLCDACSGRVWDTSDLEMEFSQLRYLRLQLLDIEEWSAFEDQFPRLEILEIQHCYALDAIPIEFAYLYGLREIKIQYCSLSTEQSAMKILEERRNYAGEDDCPMLYTRGNAPKGCTICMEHYADTDDVEVLPCSHIFHRKCVDELLKISASAVCPQCRSEIGDRGYLETYDVERVP